MDASNQLIAFLRTARWPVLPEMQPTFFSIASIGHREVPLSNTYAFFFRSDAQHGLGTLFTLAIRDLILRFNPNFPEPSSLIRASCEHPMLHGQRLDILVHNAPHERRPNEATFCLLIENKVNHGLANDLANYWDSISTAGSKFGIVLGRQIEALPTNWHYITHQELAQAVERRLGPIIHQASPRYLPLLLHFLEHLKQMSYDAMSLTQAFNFTQLYRTELAQAQKFLKELERVPQHVAQVIGAAFGNDYAVGAVRVDYPRVHVKPKNEVGIDYLIWFGHVVDLTQKPAFSITLYPSFEDEHRKESLRLLLTERSSQNNSSIGRLSWFSDEEWFDEMIVGEDYFLPNGSTLSDLEAEVKSAFETDWKPLESIWLQPVVLPATDQDTKQSYTV